MKDLLIMKFGGTSLGSAKRIRVAARLAAEGASRRPVLVVVSAMSKVTDLLLDTLRHAEHANRPRTDANLAVLRARHRQACRELLPKARHNAVMARLDELIDELASTENSESMRGNRPQHSFDEALSIGERLSAELLTECLNTSGTPAKAVNARDVVVTDAVFGNAAPIMAATRERTLKHVLPILERGAIPVVTGFNGATVDGRPTILGRGGSDFSASILAAALDASELWIWSDVQGILTADPKLVPHARVVPELSHAEAIELACCGAKILHPRTLYPLAGRKIPVWCKNSFDPEKAGTRIMPGILDTSGTRAVASMDNAALVSIEAVTPELSVGWLTERVSDALASIHAELRPLTKSGHPRQFCFLVSTDELERVTLALESVLSFEFAHGCLGPIEVDRDVALLAVVGKGTQGKTALTDRIFAAIARAKVNIVASAHDFSELTIAVVVQRDGLERAVLAVHAECLTEQPVPVLFTDPKGACPGSGDWKYAAGAFQGSEATP